MGGSGLDTRVFLPWAPFDQPLYVDPFGPGGPEAGVGPWYVAPPEFRDGPGSNPRGGYGGDGWGVEVGGADDWSFWFDPIEFFADPEEPPNLPPPWHPAYREPEEEEEEDPGIPDYWFPPESMGPLPDDKLGYRDPWIPGFDE